MTIAIVASVVMALATGAAFALPYLGALLPQGLRPEEPRHELVVKGTASARSAWRNGYLERWRVNPAQRIEAVQPDSGASDAGYGGRNGEVIALTADIATASGAVLAVTASDGETKWVAGSGETCAGLVEGDRLRCQGGRMGYYPTDLVELSTGEGRLIASSQELGARIPDGQEDSYGWSTYAVEGVLLASWTTEDGAEEPQHGNVARINAAGTGFSWRSEYSWDGVDVTGRIHHGMLNDRSFAVNVENGDLMVDVRSRGGRGPVQWVAEDVIQDGSDSSVATPLVAPDGKAVTRIGRGAVPITSQGLPKHPLRYVDGRLEAFDPGATGDSLAGPSLWSTEITFPGGAGTAAGGAGAGVLAAYHDGLIALTQRAATDRQSVGVALLEEATGRLLWQTSLGRPTPAGAFWDAVPLFSADGSPLVQVTALSDREGSYVPVSGRLVMLDPATSGTLWTKDGIVADARYDTAGLTWFTRDEPGWNSGAPFSSDLEAYRDLVVDNLDGSYSMLAPNPADASRDVLPVGAPECPSGMSPLWWTQFAEGAILVCRSGEEFSVVYPSDPGWWANELTFTGDGFEVVFSNRVTVRALLGGTLVYLEQNGTTQVHPATKAWTATGGVPSLVVPTDVHTCPAGSWPISLSTFQDGWLLVCGTATNQPVSMVLSQGKTTVSESTGVTFQAGGYCASMDVGVVCAYRVPSLITITPSTGAVSQHSVQANYFNGYGQGGAGEGTGSYGVDAPDSNAKDQVRYLTQILQRSMTGRSNIDRAVEQVRGCTELDEAIATMNSVATNREELLAALDSTPVDALKNGNTLVSKLRSALQLSHDSDLVWVQWAQSEQTNGCTEGEGSTLYRQVTQMNLAVSRAKDDFLRDWNSRIATTYDAPAFRRSQI